MKKSYEKPELNIEPFDVEDVITASHIPAELSPVDDNWVIFIPIN